MYPPQHGASASRANFCAIGSRLGTASPRNETPRLGGPQPFGFRASSDPRLAAPKTVITLQLARFVQSLKGLGTQQPEHRRRILAQSRQCPTDSAAGRSINPRSMKTALQLL